MRAITIATVAAIAVALTGCGAATTSSTPTNTPLTQTSPSTSTPNWGPAGIGDTIDMECPNPALHLSVTLLGVKRIAPSLGVRLQINFALYGVHLSIRNAASVAYGGHIGQGCRLITATGKTVKQASVAVGNSGAFVAQLNEVTLGPGNSRSGWVWFNLEPSLKPSKLQLTLSRRSPNGLNMIFGEWQL